MQTNNLGNGRVVRDYTMTTGKAYTIVIIITLLISGPMGFTYFTIWGNNSLVFDIKMMITGLIILFLLAVLHELIHAIGFMFFGKVKWSSIRFGIKWKALTPYGSCKVPVKPTVYRIALLLPTIILGVIPIIVSILFNLNFLFLTGWVMMIGGVGDLLMIWIIRNVSKNCLIIDHPEKLGCAVVEGRNNTIT